MEFEKNVGERDRLIRTILGIYGMLFGFLFVQGILGAVIGALGVVSLITGLTGWCGIYTLFNTSTVAEEENER
jgi:uncharacterized membrane protein